MDVSGPCDLHNKSMFTVSMGNNKVYATNKQVTITCGKTMDWDTFQAAGLDVGSTIQEAPTAAEIISMGQALLEW